ncbi:hypothetical protein FKW77_004688 [Venturia effusa]|uniref:Uncharacterized protein n=1 Tax=Venturia effusa TaxID=50376 RepID=A0A517LH44_9PEZI|nr:hypothetical protein FKW77_004688 [Venturia effusa]
MPAPLLDRTTSCPIEGTLSPPDTCLEQLKPPFPHLESENTSPGSNDTEAKPAIDSPSSVSPPEDSEQTQEKTGGGRFSNNPYGTVLATIAEQGSTSTLLASTNQSQWPNRMRVEQDAAALSEIRKIVTGRPAESSSEETALAEDSAELDKQSLERKDITQTPPAIESGVLQHDDDTCLRGHGPSLLVISKGPNSHHSAALGQASMRSRSSCFSPKHLFHIFPDYIQLGSASREDEKLHLVPANGTEIHPPANLSRSVVTGNEGCQRIGISEASDDTVGTRYLPQGHIPSPPSPFRKNSGNRSSASTQSSRKTVDEWSSGKCNFSASKQQLSEGISNEDTLLPTFNTNPSDHDDAAKASRSCSSSRLIFHPPPHQSCSDIQSQHRSGSIHKASGTSQSGIPSAHTFRSAALESLLPIAAAEGIIIPYTLTPQCKPQVQNKTTNTPATHFETSHSELSVLYHRGDVCRHRAAAYVAKGVKPQDTLLQMLEQVSVDGAVEIRERKDWCWRCRAEKRLGFVAGVAVPARCCFVANDRAGDVERARLVDI